MCTLKLTELKLPERLYVMKAIKPIELINDKFPCYVPEGSIGKSSMRDYYWKLGKNIANPPNNEFDYSYYKHAYEIERGFFHFSYNGRLHHIARDLAYGEFIHSYINPVILFGYVEKGEKILIGVNWTCSDQFDEVLSICTREVFILNYTILRKHEDIRKDIISRYEMFKSPISNNPPRFVSECEEIYYKELTEFRKIEVDKLKCNPSSLETLMWSDGRRKAIRRQYEEAKRKSKSNQVG